MKLVFISTFFVYIVYPLFILGSNVSFSYIFVNQHVARDIPPCHILTLRRAYVSHNENEINYKIEHKCLNILQIFILSVGVITLLWLSCLHPYNHVRYVCFATNLSLLSKKITCNELFVSPIFSSLLALVLLIELENTQILLFVVLMNPNFERCIDFIRKFIKIVLRTIFTILSLYMFYVAITPVSCLLILFVFQIWTFLFKKNVPFWVPMLLIRMSNDIHLNPGPQPNHQNNCLNFMNWNLNSLTKDNFHRVDLIEAHNSIFNYDLISVCETNLDDRVELPETLLNDYTLEPANHHLNIKHGGVDLFL